jgi:serine/threonine protein phosphatase 1
MAGRTIAIGDIHGCSAALEALIREIRPTLDDTLITLGDYIDRGPNSKRVIDVLMAMRTRCKLINLKGNHELLMLRGLESPAQMPFWMQSGGQATLASYGGAKGVPQNHLDFLNDCLHYHETDSHIFVHANYHPELELHEQDETHLFWEHLHFVLPGPHFSQKTVIVGHTPQRNGEILDCGYLVCIDTYCFGTGWLTAYEVDNGTTWQADKSGRVRT